MICFPNAKINLGLNIKSKREDGFHNIETVFYPVGLTDILEIIISHDGKKHFKSSGLQIPGSPEKNLCLDAYNLMTERYALPPVSIYLHKVIPPGSGLGGGSSDAAHMIYLLNKTFLLNLSEEKMKDHAREIGSDCAFFIDNKAKFAYNKGDQFENIGISLKDYYIVIIKPPVDINTKSAYSEAIISDEKGDIRKILEQPIEFWRRDLKNDFELSVFKMHPEIKSIKNKLYEQGAIYVSLSGSGSAVYGIFQEKPFIQEYWTDHFYWEGILK